MRICGIDLKGNEAIIVILDGNRSHFEVIECVKKLNLENDESSEEVKSFKNTFDSLVQDISINKIVIKKRNKKGDYAGGPVSFKLEGLLQMVSGCEIELVSAVSIASVIKKAEIVVPIILNKYQNGAFETAFYGLG